MDRRIVDYKNELIQNQSMNTKPVLILIALPLFFAACTSAKLKPGAEKITVSEKAAPANCKDVGELHNSKPLNLAGEEAAGILKRIEMNEAFEKGANYIRQDLSTSTEFKGRAYICPQ